MKTIDWYAEGELTGRTFDWAFPEGINPWDHFGIGEETAGTSLKVRRAIRDFEKGFDSAFHSRMGYKS